MILNGARCNFWVGVAEVRILYKEFYHLILTHHYRGGVTQRTFLTRLYFVMYSYIKGKYDESVHIVLISLL